ncbi:MAG: SpoIIE family protein phosphatase [Candidatus Acidiferrum sp.]
MNRKILFVDDEPAALKLYSHMVQGEFDIMTAVGGEDGLVLLREHGPFAIVVSDMQMAGMNGVQFLRIVRQVDPNSVRILLTGHIDLKGAVDAVNEGSIFRLLMKPCKQEALTEAITTALDSCNRRREDRVRIKLPVKLYRSARGLRFQSAHTEDISASGARLAGIEEPLDPGEVLEVECSNRRAPYRVVWIGEQDTAAEGQAGLACLAVEADIWKLDLCQLEDGEALERARVVQRGLLPQEKPPLTTLDYDGHCIQARMIGGDYYDFLDMGPGEVGFALADVSGKGIPAALLMASLQGSLHSLYGAVSRNLPQLLTSVNLHFYKHTSQARYATFFFGHYSDATQTLRYINCGHNPPILLRKGGAVERLIATAMVLGLFPDWECSTASVQLETGDVLSIYTDGITETLGCTGEEFGEARLLALLRNSRNLEAVDIVRNIENAVEQFRRGEQKDDLTLVIARAR